MVDIVPPRTVLTPADATNAFTTSGLDVLGLTIPFLAPAWATQPGTVSLDETEMTLTFAAGLTVRAPFRGMLRFVGDGVQWSGANGQPIGNMVAALTLHPEAARRLERLLDARHGDAAMISAPVAMIVRGVTTPNVIPVPNWYEAGEPLLASMLAGNPPPAPQPVTSAGGSTTISFHDARGLPIDPVAVAGLFLDLLNAQAALQRFAPGVQLADTGTAQVGLSALSALVGGTRIQIIDPHGWPFRSAAGGLGLQSNTGQVPGANGLITVTGTTDALVRASGDDATRPFRWGWARSGTLGNQPLPLPADANPPNRRFLRCMAVDLAWHLLGNRQGNPAANAGTGPAIPPDDGTTPAFALPKVRTAVPNLAFLPDAMAVLGATGQMATDFAAAANVADSIALLAAPEIDDTLAVPPTIADRWPQFPATAGNTVLPRRIDVRDKLTAQRCASGPGDVVVTIPGTLFPAEIHLRVHPRRFVELTSIEPGVPSFVRGDGAATITDGSDRALFLADPFGDPPGAPDFIELDLVATDRSGNRRIFSLLRLPLGGAPVARPADYAFGGTAILASPALTAPGLPFFRSIAPTPVFGIPGPATTPIDFTDLPSLAKALTSEGQPRQGPRLPTQARFDTVFALGWRTAAQAQLRFEAVLTGARFTWESRSRRPELGDPGNPAGPDVHAAGVRCDGALAYDLALHALKRTLPLANIDTSGAPGSIGWAAQTKTDSWDAPSDGTSGTASAAMLETVAYGVDTPELGLIPRDPTKPIQLSEVTDLIGSDLDPGIDNEAEITARLDREFATSRAGQRDALWSLARAFAEAREMIYIESAAFGRTAGAAGSTAHAIDLVGTLRTAMEANRRLKLVICVPRMPDFASPARADWERTALRRRSEALMALLGEPLLKPRVAAFHPASFPGRHAAIRSTVVIVDDVYALVGTSHLRRRGMTFDGGCDIAAIDRAMAGGYSASIAAFRRQLMAAKLGIEAPALLAQTDGQWIRLGTPEGAFDAVADLLAEGGAGQIKPIWAGPTDTNVLAADPDAVDPDGGPGGTDLFELLKKLL